MNLNRGAAAVKLFELGRAYEKSDSGVKESSRLAAVLLGPVAETFWKAERCPPSDLYDAKGLVEDLLANVPGIRWEPLGGHPLFHPGASFGIATSQGPLGAVGLLHPGVARNWELERENAAIFELDLGVLASLSPSRTQFAPYGLFPSSRRDLSILLDRQTAYSKVLETVQNCGLKEELAKTELVDVFQGKGIPADKKSLTLRLTFRRAERTLKDSEVNAAVEKILAALKGSLGAELRS